MLRVANTRAISVTFSAIYIYIFLKTGRKLFFLSRFSGINQILRQTLCSNQKSNLSKSQVAPGRSHSANNTKVPFFFKLGSYDDFRFAPKQLWGTLPPPCGMDVPVKCFINFSRIRYFNYKVRHIAIHMRVILTKFKHFKMYFWLFNYVFFKCTFKCWKVFPLKSIVHFLTLDGCIWPGFFVLHTNAGA